MEKTENVGFYDALDLLATRAGLEMPRRSAGQGGDSDGKPTRKEQFDVLKWAENELEGTLRA